MIKYAAVPLLAILAACSAQVESEAAEEDVVETLSVNNLVITDSNTAAVPGEVQTQVATPAEPAPVADRRAGRATASEPEQPARTSTEAAAKPAPKPRAEVAADSGPGAESPAVTCTAEHREMGHC